jgi:hypothetical protein
MFKLAADMKRALQRFGQLEQPRAERLPATGLGALCGPESATWPAGVRNISSTGIYLATERRLRTGETINLVLVEDDKILLQEGFPEHGTDCRIFLHARVARQGEDGLGLSFVLPPGLDSALWGVLVKSIVQLNDRIQIEEMFRTLRTILFLCHLCHSEAEEAIVLLGGHLNPLRVASLVKIAIAAEDRLAAEPDFERMRAHPKLLAHLLREGSWTQDPRVLQLWAGLLVASCSKDAPDESNLICADLLRHVGPEEARIFVQACERAVQNGLGEDGSPSGLVVLTPDEMRQVSDRTDLTRPSNVMAYLYRLGLLEKLFDFSSYIPVENFDVTPSRLGLELYKRCQGQRGSLAPELVEKANACLLTIIEEPHPPI